MKYSIDNELLLHENVRNMLTGIPRELWDIFLPETAQELALLDFNIKTFESEQEDRNQVMAIQRLCEFPLRPNDSLHETEARARRQGEKFDELYRRQQNDSGATR